MMLSHSITEDIEIDCGDLPNRPLRVKFLWSFEGPYKHVVIIAVWEIIESHNKFHPDLRPLDYRHEPKKLARLTLQVEDLFRDRLSGACEEFDFAMER